MRILTIKVDEHKELCHRQMQKRTNAPEGGERRERRDHQLAIKDIKHARLNHFSAAVKVAPSRATTTGNRL